MRIEAAVVGRPLATDIGPPEDEVLCEFDVDRVHTADDEAGHEGRRSDEVSSGSDMSSSKSDGISNWFEQSLPALQIRNISETVAQMQATRPEIIRAAPVRSVLGGLARPLRGVRRDFYHLSQTTTRLNAFWSHSWHGSAKQKIASLFFFTMPPQLRYLAALRLSSRAFSSGWIFSQASALRTAPAGV